MSKHLLLGVSGGIAAYKACDLVRRFQDRGWTVRVALTPSAQALVTAKTFEALTGSKVWTDTFESAASGYAHIELAKWADVFLIAPATAHTMGECALGLATSLLSNVFLACDRPTFFAPAMNTKMWNKPTVQHNLSTLRDIPHVKIVAPDMGLLGCRDTGVGKLADVSEILTQVDVAQVESDQADGNHVQGQELPKTAGSEGRPHVLMTAGATREYLDPVRFLSTPSSGKMATALAQALLDRGAQVTMVLGHVDHRPDSRPGLTLVDVDTAQDMFDAVVAHHPKDVFVGVASVSDFRPVERMAEKIKRGESGMELSLTQNPDILAWVSEHRETTRLVVGFAAESEAMVEHAEQKLEKKGCDWIIANRVGSKGSGFGENASEFAWLKRGDETKELGTLTKHQMARQLADAILASIGVGAAG